MHITVCLRSLMHRYAIKPAQKACVAQIFISSKCAIQMHDPPTHNKLERSLKVSLHNLLFLFIVFDASSLKSLYCASKQRRHRPACADAQARPSPRCLPM